MNFKSLTFFAPLTLFIAQLIDERPDRNDVRYVLPSLEGLSPGPFLRLRIRGVVAPTKDYLMADFAIVTRISMALNYLIKFGYISRLCTLGLMFVMALGFRALSSTVYESDACGNLVASYPSASTAIVPGALSSHWVQTGDRSSISVLANGPGPIYYQWQKDGTDLFGATNDSLIVTNLTSADYGVYSVVVSNCCTVVTNGMGSPSPVIAVPTTSRLISLAYGGGRWLAVGADMGLLTSTNAANWFSVASNPYPIGYRAFILPPGDFGLLRTMDNYSQVAFGDGKFEVAWTEQKTYRLCVPLPPPFDTSTNCEPVITNLDNAGRVIFTNDFVVNNLGLDAGLGSNGVAFTGGQFVSVVGGDRATYAGGVLFSFPSLLLDGATLVDAVYSAGLFVAIGAASSGNSAVYTSTDSTSWTERASLPSTPHFNAITLFKGLFVAIGPPGSNYVSSDGVQWAWEDSGTTNALYALASGNGILLAVGDNGAIIELHPVPPSFTHSTQADHFQLSFVPSPQLLDGAFDITVTALDSASGIVSNFSGPVALTASVSLPLDGGLLLGDISTTSSLYTDEAYAGYSVGYSFTPATDIKVTHVRTWFGSQVGIWSDTNQQLLTLNVPSTVSNWVETPLPVPLNLSAGHSYVVGVYSVRPEYFGQPSTRLFKYGSVDTPYFSVANTNSTNVAFPSTPDNSGMLPLLDLRYQTSLRVPLLFNPTFSDNFQNGVWSGTATVNEPGVDITMTAEDNLGHSGTSNPFIVEARNDVSIVLSAHPEPISIRSNLTFAVSVINTGPATATGVTVTDQLPAGLTFVSAVSSQGNCANQAGTIICNLGSLAASASASVTIIASPSAANCVLTNTVTVSRNELDADYANNFATTVDTVSPPQVSISDVSLPEGNFGFTTFPFEVNLSGPSAQTVLVPYATSIGTAIPGIDFVSGSGLLAFAAGITNQAIPVLVAGNTKFEPDKTFYVNLSLPNNATLVNTRAIGTILNDDGLPSEIDHFTWSQVSSPQLVNQPFQVGLTAQDVAGNPLTNFTGPVSIAATSEHLGETNTILGSLEGSSVDEVMSTNATASYTFTPNKDLIIVKLRHYSGSKVILWDMFGNTLASQNITDIGGAWVETPLDLPVQLLAGQTYRVGAVTVEGNGSYYKISPRNGFVDGTINGNFLGTGAGDPYVSSSSPDNSFCSVVDVVYKKGHLPTILNLANYSYDYGTFVSDLTAGYSFTPSTNLIVTHVRHRFGNKVSIWTDDGVLLAAQNITNTGNAWLGNALTNPVTLLAGARYRVGVHTHDIIYYNWKSGTDFADGELNDVLANTGDVFPSAILPYNAGGAAIPLVDLVYRTGAPPKIPVSPGASDTFSNGVWVGSIILSQVATDMRLLAADNLGHSGLGNPFDSIQAPGASDFTAGTLANQPLHIGSDKFLANSFNPGGYPLSLLTVSATSTNGGIVLLDRGLTTYAPVPDFVGADRFSYTVGDGRGYTATANVRVQVFAASRGAGSFGLSTSIADGLLAGFVGLPDLTYTVQRAFSLTGPWTNLTTFTTGTNATGQFFDPSPPTGGAFYRVNYP